MNIEQTEAFKRLETAHQELLSLIRTIPDRMLDWVPENEEWSIRQILGHLAHANDFYRMIIGEARAANFGEARLHLELEGVRQMEATDRRVAQCQTVDEVIGCIEHTYRQLQSTVSTLSEDELDRSFTLKPLRHNVEPYKTTLRQRVLQSAAEHIDEHQAPLAELVAAWKENARPDS